MERLKKRLEKQRCQDMERLEKQHREKTLNDRRNVFQNSYKNSLEKVTPVTLTYFLKIVINSIGEFRFRQELEAIFAVYFKRYEDIFKKKPVLHG